MGLTCSVLLVSGAQCSDAAGPSLLSAYQDMGVSHPFHLPHASPLVT